MITHGPKPRLGCVYNVIVLRVFQQCQSHSSQLYTVIRVNNKRNLITMFLTVKTPNILYNLQDINDRVTNHGSYRPCYYNHPAQKGLVIKYSFINRVLICRLSHQHIDNYTSGMGSIPFGQFIFYI